MCNRMPRFIGPGWRGMEVEARRGESTGNISGTIAVSDVTWNTQKYKTHAQSHENTKYTLNHLKIQNTLLVKIAIAAKMMVADLPCRFGPQPSLDKCVCCSLLVSKLWCFAMCSMCGVTRVVFAWWQLVAVSLCVGNLGWYKLISGLVR